MKPVILILLLITCLNVPVLAGIEKISLPVRTDFIISANPDAHHIDGNSNINQDLEGNKNTDANSTSTGSSDGSEYVEIMEGEYPFLVKPKDIENRDVQLELDYVTTTYKDNTSTEYYFPVLIRIDTGRDTEVRIASGFLEYQNPRWGFNDVVVGFKWQFHEGNPSMGILANVEFPSSSAGLGDCSVEPSLGYLVDCKITERWDFAANFSFCDKIDNTSKERYIQILPAIQTGYSIDDRNYVFAAIGGKYPNKKPGGIGLMTAGVGYTINVHKNTQLNFTIARGLSPIDKAWLFDTGLNFKFE
jgi:hypothetical protein